MYIDMYQFGPAHLYTNDFFLNRSIQHEASILYKFFKFFPITPDNDYFGLFLHLIFSTLAGFFLYLILLKHTEISDKKFILIFLFAILLIGTFFNPSTGNTVTWVSGNSINPTYFTHGLSFFLFWLALEKKPIALSVVSSLMILIAFKASWFIIGCASLYSLIYFNNSKEKIWIIAPIICTLYLSQFAISPNGYEDKLFIFEDIVKNDNVETSFFLLNNFFIFKIIISFFIFFFIWNQSINNNFKKFSLIVLIVSIATFLFGYVYFGYGYKIFPIPQLALIGLTRGFGFYELLFWINIGIYIFKLNINNIFKTTFLVLVFYALASFKGLIVGVLINIFAYLTQIIYNKIKITKKKFNIDIFNESSKLSNALVFLFFLALSPGIIYLSYQKFDKSFNLYSLQKIKKATIGDLYDNQRIDTAISLRECNDFILMDPIYQRITSSIARKSNFIGASYFNNLDIELINEAKKRRKISIKLEKSILNFSEVTDNLFNEIKFYKPIIIIKKKFLQRFPKNVNYHMIRSGEVLINFYEEEENKKFINNCIDKIS